MSIISLVCDLRIPSLEAYETVEEYKEIIDVVSELKYFEAYETNLTYSFVNTRERITEGDLRTLMDELEVLRGVLECRGHISILYLDEYTFVDYTLGDRGVGIMSMTLARDDSPDWDGG